VEPQAVIDLGTSPTHRSWAGHILALGVHVFIFGTLAYLTFLNQGGIPGELLLIYVSALPLAIAIATVVQIARAKRRMAAHHVISGCLNAVLLCGVGGIWVAFRDQILFTLFGSLVVVWLTRYSTAAQFLRPPSLSDVAGSAPLPEHRSVRTLVTLAGALALLVGGIALACIAVFSEMQRPGGLNITVGL